MSTYFKTPSPLSAYDKQATTMSALVSILSQMATASLVAQTTCGDVRVLHQSSVCCGANTSKPLRQFFGDLVAEFQSQFQGRKVTQYEWPHIEGQKEFALSAVYSWSGAGIQPSPDDDALPVGRDADSPGTGLLTKPNVCSTSGSPCEVVSYATRFDAFPSGLKQELSTNHNVDLASASASEEWALAVVKYPTPDALNAFGMFGAFYPGMFDYEAIVYHRPSQTRYTCTNCMLQSGVGGKKANGDAYGLSDACTTWRAQNNDRFISSYPSFDSALVDADFDDVQCTNDVELNHYNTAGVYSRLQGTNSFSKGTAVLSASDVLVRQRMHMMITNLLGMGNRYSWWRGRPLMVDRFAGHLSTQPSFGVDDLYYEPTCNFAAFTIGSCQGSSWNRAVFSSFFEPTRQELTDLTAVVSDPKLRAVLLVLKAYFYEMYTNTYGAVPLDAESVARPPSDVYAQSIAMLDEAISIADANVLSPYAAHADFDIVFRGDTRKWQKLANSLKLRMALRAHNHPTDHLSDAAAEEAVKQAVTSGTLLDDDASIVSSPPGLSQWIALPQYADIASFEIAGIPVSEALVTILKELSDPRLQVYAKPAKGGKVNLTTAEYELLLPQLTDDMYDLLINDTSTDTIGIDLVADTHYIGMPLRSKLFTNVASSVFSTMGTRLDSATDANYPMWFMTSANVHFMIADAAQRGLLANCDAADHFRTGVQQARRIWGIVGGGAVEELVAETALKQIATQRWLASYTHGIEAWSVVRETGFPSSAAAAVSDSAKFVIGGTEGKVPERMTYATSKAYSTDVQTDTLTEPLFWSSSSTGR